MRPIALLICSVRLVNPLCPNRQANCLCAFQFAKDSQQQPYRPVTRSFWFCLGQFFQAEEPADFSLQLRQLKWKSQNRVCAGLQHGRSVLRKYHNGDDRD